ncbi:MAG TPA: substrate binding domain-containing protein [Limnobacter sp.]|nr:substrate binding domain-containing protein [Limnobacter sp.]
MLCAAPKYLRKFGEPKSPKDLEEHTSLCFRLNDRTHDRWSFVKGKQKVTVKVHGSVQCDDGDAVRKLALLGRGIAYKSRLDIAQDLKAGRLLPLCQDWLGEPTPLYLVSPDRSQVRPLVRVLRDFLLEQIALLKRS